MDPFLPIGTSLIITTGFLQKQKNFPLSWYSSWPKTHTCLVYAKFLERLLIFKCIVSIDNIFIIIYQYIISIR